MPLRLTTSLRRTARLLRSRRLCQECHSRLGPGLEAARFCSLTCIEAWTWSETPFVASPRPRTTAGATADR